MSKENIKHVNTEILEEDVTVSLSQLCRMTKLSAEVVIEMIEYGVIEPSGNSDEKWEFTGECIKRVRSAYHLKRDLGLNTAGAALAIDLLEEISELKSRLRHVEILLPK